jgi:hypothetical protein
MPIPPKGDPLRPLHLAIHWTRVLGGLLVVFATCVTIAFVLRRGPMRGNSVPAFYFIFVVFYLLPGACFIVFSIFLARRRAWAVVASLCLASVGCLVVLGAIGVMIVLIVANRAADWRVMIPIGVMALILAALGQLIYHLARSFEAIHYTAPAERGFEPIMMQNPNDETSAVEPAYSQDNPNQ